MNHEHGFGVYLHLHCENRRKRLVSISTTRNSLASGIRCLDVLVAIVVGVWLTISLDVPVAEAGVGAFLGISRLARVDVSRVLLHPKP